jgi:hypothetical protein
VEKLCIFCGNPPQEKNKEHIIPRWLMKLTNTENKKMSVGINWKTKTEIIFNFSSFTFPSCTKCNTDFAKMEALVKPIVEKILNDDYVKTDELLHLLDWFDKVRMSLWLGIQYHNKGTFNIEPKYYINTRIALKDRFLAITNCYDNYLGLRWTGVNTLSFIMSPTCFTLKVNNILFTNCSSDFAVSEQLGFPYPLFVRPNPKSNLTDFLIGAGKNKLENSLFKSILYPPTTIVCQPIYAIGKGGSPAYYDNDYVRSNSYDFKKGIGKIFVTHNSFTYPLESDEEISFGDIHSKEMKKFKLNRPTLELQIELLYSTNYNLEFLNDEQKKNHHEGLKTVIEHTKEQIKYYDY